MNRRFQIYLFCLLTWVLSSCSVTRHIDDGDLLVKKISYKGIDNRTLYSGLDDNLGYSTNKYILSIYPFYLQAWNFGKDGRDSAAIREFIREKIGEKPVLLDSSILNASTTQLELYLFNNGYFNSVVKYRVRKKRKKAFITYDIKLNVPYKVADIEYRVYDRDLYKLMMEDTSGNKIEVGDLFNTDKMSTERNRIAQYLRNRGYYFFDKEYISFDVDSNQGNFSANIAIEVKNPSTYKRHQIYQFNEIYVDINYPYYLHGVDDSTFTELEGLNIRTQGMQINKNLFLEFIRIRGGVLYSDQAILNTYNRLYGLQIFGTVRIDMIADTGAKLIDVYINLVPDPTMKLSVEPQLITSDQSSSVLAANQRIWGLSGQVTFRNKNLFKGAELLDLSYSGAAEFQYSNQQFSLSNLQQSVNASLAIPKFLWISKTKFIRQSARKKDWLKPTTRFSLTFSYQYNPDFIQRTTLLSMSYEAGRGFNYFRFVPLELNLNQVTIKSDFLKNLSPGDKVLLSSLLNPNFIPSSRMEWYYDDKGLSPTGNYHKFRLAFEPAGNLFYSGLWINSELSGTAKPANGYKVFNTNLFQFAKLDFDLRYYSKHNEDIKMAYRIHTGLAYPYGNSRVIPFDKRFFIGGANSLRGWVPRSIGPGTYGGKNANQIDRSGEIVAEGSAEIRFRVIRNFLEGALFLDGGNIWNINADSSLPGAEISWLFFNQFALNTGIGARFDFSFFLVRLDMGAQLRDPSYLQKGGWVVKDFNYFNRRITFNFGIGYPF